MADLNEDLIREILLRLPRPSLAKFPLVSKPWKILISSPSFIKEYNTMNLTFFNFIYNEDDNGNNNKNDNQSQQQLYSLRINLPYQRFSPESKTILTVDSSNGLILNGALVEVEGFGLYYMFFVSNPIINECRFLPPSPLKLSHPPTSFSLISGLVIWFGFDQTSEWVPPHYIVVKLYRKDHHNLEIYSLYSIDITWSRTILNLSSIIEVTEDINFQLISGSVFFNRKLYWITSTGDVFVFRPKKQRCFLIQGPLGSKSVCSRSHKTKGTKIARSGESRHRLDMVAFDVDKVKGNFTFYVWSLKDYNNGKWVCDYWVDVGSFDTMASKGPEQCYLEVVGISPLDPRILCLNLGFALYLYNVKTKEIHLLHEYKNDNALINVRFQFQSYCHYVVPSSPPLLDPHLIL